VTAAIDRDGRVLARLAPFTEGRLDVEVQGYAGATPYVRFGDWPALALCVLALLGCARLRRSR
jgi:apolipoprotein N-acyltransferase